MIGRALAPTDDESGGNPVIVLSDKATQSGASIAGIVRVTDPIAYAASLIVIVAACLFAAWIPATRAARLDPMLTLRQECSGEAGGPGKPRRCYHPGDLSPNGPDPDQRTKW